MIAMMVTMTFGGDCGDADEGGDDFGYGDYYSCDSYDIQIIYLFIYLFVYLFIYLFI